jgi:predicted DCC family thiol-disulfide oxidoreductase YuxK
VSAIIVFDALCVLCSANAQLVLRRDWRGRFKLASLQSEIGQQLYRKVGLDPSDPQSLIVVDADRLLTDSDAVIAIWTGLGGPWTAAAAFRIVPRSVRDLVYRWIARNRYRLFGKREVCWVPAPSDRGRLL